MIYSIANITVEFTGDRASDVTSMDRFTPFKTELPSSQIKIDVSSEHYDFDTSTPLYFLAYDNTEFSFHLSSQNEYLYRLYNTETKSIFCIRHFLGTNLAEIKGDGDINMLIFATWVAYGITVLKYNRVPIHTSTIEYGGKGVMFLGESGTGKSTHTRLWRENIEGARLLNDDSPVIEATDEGIFVYGSPWSGKTPCYKQQKAELKGIVRLSQAPYNKIKHLNIIESFTALYPSCPPSFAHNEVLSDGVCSFVSKILKQIKVYHLECLPDAAAAQLSFNTIIGEGISK